MPIRMTDDPVDPNQQDDDGGGGGRGPNLPGGGGGLIKLPSMKALKMMLVKIHCRRLSPY